MRFMKCVSCGVEFDAEEPSVHACEGSPGDRLAALEKRVSRLENRVFQSMCQSVAPSGARSVCVLPHDHVERGEVHLDYSGAWWPL